MGTNRRLKAARVGKGLTQLQLAEKIDGKEIEISRYETGRSNPYPETKQRIANVLGKPEYELFSH